MKKSIITIFIVCLLAIPSFSDTITITDYKEGFKTFADDMAAALPLNTMVGLNWSDAYIGQLIDLPPHFGIGLTGGFTTVPYDAFKKIMVDTLKTPESDIPSVIRDYGLPLPAMVIDGRVGGFILPFDVGFKLGFLPKQVKDSIDKKVDIDYLLVGFDFRYKLLDQTFIVIPEISVGAGFNYLKGSVTLSDIVPGTTISDLGTVNPALSGQTLSLSSPDFSIDWTSKVFDLKAQASWSLLIIQPSIGVGLSYAKSSVTGGAASTLLLNGNPLTTTQKDYFRAFGFDVDNTGISVSSDVTSWGFRAFGGMSVNILLLRVDFGLMYDLIGKNWGATVGGRLQL